MGSIGDWRESVRGRILMEGELNDLVKEEKRFARFLNISDFITDDTPMTVLSVKFLISYRQIVGDIVKTKIP